MKYLISCFLLFVLQVYLILRGEEHFGIYLNPAILFLVSMTIPVLYLSLLWHKQVTELPARGKSTGNLLILAVMLTGGLFLVYAFEDGIRKYPDPVLASDVLPQLEAVFDRFSRGEQPYYPLPLPTHAPFPVYMPAHWLPIGISRIFHLDARWSGLILLLAAMVFWALITNTSRKNPWLLLLAGLPIPAAAVLFSTKGGADLLVTYETPVAAFYLLLATGLQQRNLRIIAIGLLLCLLSRYTLIFWLPVFAYLLFTREAFKKNVAFWLFIAAGITGIYIIPLLIRAPETFLLGLKYHNDAAIAEWKGVGPEAISWTFNSGIYFAPHFRQLFGGSMEHRVFCARLVQGSLMILLCIVSVVLYHRWKHRINWFDFALAALYSFLVFFYMFGPLTYRYYLLTNVLLSGLITSRIILIATALNQKRPVAPAEISPSV